MTSQQKEAIMKAGEQQSPEEDKVSTKNKKDYFEGYKAPLNNTFTGDAIRRLFPQQSKMTEMGGGGAIGAAFVVFVQSLKVAFIVTVAILELVANGIGALAFGYGASALGIRANNKPAQTKQTDFLSEEDVSSLDNPEPGSSTGNDIAAPIIESPSNKEGRIPLEEPKILQTIKVDDTKQQMERFAGNEYRRLSTIEEDEERESLDQQKGPHAGPDSKEDNVAKLDPKNT